MFIGAGCGLAWADLPVVVTASDRWVSVETVAYSDGGCDANEEDFAQTLDLAAWSESIAVSYECDLSPNASSAAAVTQDSSISAERFEATASMTYDFSTGEYIDPETGEQFCGNAYGSASATYYVWFTVEETVGWRMAASAAGGNGSPVVQVYGPKDVFSLASGSAEATGLLEPGAYLLSATLAVSADSYCGDEQAAGVGGFDLVFELRDACLADFAAPFGELDFSDVVSFLAAFGGGDPAADLAAPFGVLDFSDVVSFLSSFGAGCP